MITVAGIPFLVSLFVGGAFLVLPIFSRQILRVASVVLAFCVFFLMIFGNKHLFGYFLIFHAWLLLQTIYYLIFSSIQNLVKTHESFSLKKVMMKAVLELSLIFVFTTLIMVLTEGKQLP